MSEFTNDNRPPAPRLFSKAILGRHADDADIGAPPSWWQRLSARCTDMGLPPSAPCGTWETIWAQARKKHPVRYLLFRSLPRCFARWIKDPINRVYWWVRHRTVAKFHIVVLRDVEPGYADADYRLVFSAFSLLVDYVEVECALMQESPSRWKSLCSFFVGADRALRNPAAGVAYLTLEANLDDPDRPPHERVYQGYVAREFLALYHWWKVERGTRVDDFEHELENYDEDTAMLTRLVAVRRGLWT